MMNRPGSKLSRSPGFEWVQGEVPKTMRASNAISRRQFFRAALAVASSGAAAERHGLPKQVLIIRHAEKTGLKTDVHLNQRGYERAAALVRLFPATFETPDVLFAAHRTAYSNRPVETVTPLANALNLKIDDRFGEDQYRALAKALHSGAVYRGKTVLVCWHHGRIPALAAALGVKSPPSSWPDGQFDRAWKIQYANGTVTFADLPQHLLAGDS